MLQSLHQPSPPLSNSSFKNAINQLRVDMANQHTAREAQELAQHADQEAREDHAVADQEEQETQQKSELDIGFTALSYGAMEPGVVGRRELAATACRHS